MEKGITLQELDAAVVNKLVIRDSAGRAKVTAPTVADDIALKSTVDNAVGSLPNLLTTAKANTVSAINELFINVSNGKTSVAAAITGKGIVASGSDTFTQLADKIGQIVTGSRWASGQTEAYTPSAINININNLTFKPSKVIVLLANYWRSSSTFWGVICNDSAIMPTVFATDKGYPVRSPVITLGNNGFTATGEFGYTSGAQNYISWIAIE